MKNTSIIKNRRILTLRFFIIEERRGFRSLAIYSDRRDDHEIFQKSEACGKTGAAEKACTDTQYHQAGCEAVC